MLKGTLIFQSVCKVIIAAYTETKKKIKRRKKRKKKEKKRGIQRTEGHFTP
jgi:hypothetical protein